MKTGWKTYAGAAVIAIIAVNKYFHWWSNDVDDSILAMAAALGLVGIRYAVAKSEQTNQEIKHDIQSAKERVIEKVEENK